MKVAILSWGDVIEDFLDPLGLDLITYATKMSGGWLFGYLDALRRADVDGCIIVVSVSVSRTTRLVNPETGVVTMALPALPGFRALRKVIGRERSGLLATPQAALRAALEAEGVTHILCQEYEYHRATAALAVGRRMNIPVLATFQGGQPARGRAERRSRARTISRLDGFIIASSGEAERVRKTYGIEDALIRKIPNPLDLNQWRPMDRAKARHAAGISQTTRIVVCHTRIEIARKGLDVLMEAWRQVVPRIPEADLAIHLIGTGSDEHELRDRLARNPLPGLRWTGYTADRAEMRRELSAADLYVSSSRHEGFAVAPLEAMACGLPVILSTAPGSTEILPRGEADGGCITQAGNAGALADAIETLLRDPDRMGRLGQAARSRANAFGLDVVGAQLAAVLTT